MILTKSIPVFSQVQTGDNYQLNETKSEAEFAYKFSCNTVSDVELKVFHSMYKKEEEAERAFLEISSNKNGEQFAKLKVVAKNDSIDEAAKELDGGLGWVKFGQFTKDFENAIYELPVQTLSHPIKSDFGWHIVWIDEARDIKTKLPCILSEAL